METDYQARLLAGKRVLLGKYYHKTPFLKANRTQASSQGWKGILHGRDLILQHLEKAIGNGETTKVWTDSWICTSNDLIPSGLVLPQDQDLMVADLLSRETKEWNKALVEKILPELTDHIFSIRPSTMDAPDSYIWTQQDSGIYSVKSGYYAAQLAKIQSTNLLLNNADGEWNWKKFIWTPKLLPKIKLFLWKCAMNNLPTGDNLRKKGYWQYLLHHLWRRGNAGASSLPF